MATTMTPADCLALLDRVGKDLCAQATPLRLSGRYTLAFQLYLAGLDILRLRLDYLELLTQKKLARGARIQAARILTKTFGPEPPAVR